MPAGRTIVEYARSRISLSLETETLLDVIFVFLGVTSGATEKQYHFIHSKQDIKHKVLLSRQ